MNKFILSLALAGCFVSALAQSSVTMTLNVDHADRITVTYLDRNYDEVTVDNLVDGDNTLTIPVSDYSATSVDIKALEGYGLESCTSLNVGQTEPTNHNIQFMTSSYFDAAKDPSTNGATWNVRTFDFAEKRTASATFIVDNASKVKVKRVASNTAVALADGDNEVRFIPADDNSEGESVFSITPADSEKPFYRVLVNGEVPEGYDSGNQNVTIGDSDVVTIMANYPDIDVPVRFTYTETGFGFVTGVKADGEPVEFDGYTANVRCGSKVEFTYDENNYVLQSITINGEVKSYPYSPLSLGVVTEEVNVGIDARKVGNYTFDVKVNDASYVKLLAFEEGASIYYGGWEVPLNSGDNPGVEVSDKRHFFSIEARTRSKLSALKLNGEAIEQVEKTDWSGNTYKEWPFPIEIKQGDVLEITGSGPERDNDAVLYIDRIPEGAYSFSFNMNGYAPQVKDGYNSVRFDDNTDAEIGDLPFNIDLMYSPMTSWAYVNDVAIEPTYHSESSDNYKLTTVADKSVIKVFTLTEPTTHNVTFSLTGVTEQNILATKDIILDVTDPAAGFTVTGPTEICLTVDVDVDKEVEANGTAVTPAEDGTYRILIDSDTQISVKGESSRICAAEISDPATLCDIYTLQGVCVKRSAGISDLESLPSGIYIVNGKKVRL